MKYFRYYLCVIMLLILSIQIPLLSEENNEPLIEEFNKNFKKKYFSLGVVLQAVSDFQVERNLPGNNGFSIANTRLTISGELDHKFGYLLRTNFVSPFTLLDVKMYYKFSDPFTLEFGQFKSPFSKEFILPVESIYFVNRSRVVTVLVPGRQIGFQFRGTPSGRLPFSYALGIFNGNGTNTNQNDNNDFLFGGRILLSSREVLNTSIDYIELGLNGAFSRDSATRIGEELNPFVFEPLFFDGDRMLLGADFQIDIKKFMIAGEYINGEYTGTFTSLNNDSILQDIKAKGFHLTTGYMIHKKVQLLARWDNFDTDRRENSNWFIAGINSWPTQATEFQVNYVINSDEPAFKYNQLLINVQIVL